MALYETNHNSEKDTTMYDNIFTHIAVFLYNAAPVIATIVIALLILNAVRIALVAKRKANVIKKNTPVKRESFNDHMFEPLTFN